MLAELRVIFPLEISPCFSCQWAGRDQTRGAKVFVQCLHDPEKPAQPLLLKSLTFSLSSITDGPFPAVPGSQDTEVLGHWFCLHNNHKQPQQRPEWPHPL